MDQILIDLLVGAGAHALPIVAVIWLAIENRRLQNKLETVYELQKSVVNLAINHGQKLDGIEQKAMRRINDRITNEPGAVDNKN
jgi:hypothetical protein